MPCSPWVYLDRRIGLPVCAFVMLLLMVCGTSGERAFAAENLQDISVSQKEVYGQLKAGKRVWQDKNYVRPERPTVYLTFDDGPSKLTGKVLEILREEDVSATFFVLGELVKTHPELVRQALDEGHAIGNHTYNHRYKELYSSVETFWRQVVQTEEALDEAAGVKPSLIRAPGGTYGNFDPFYYYYLDQAGYEVHDWNIDSGDSKRAGVPATEIVQTVKKGALVDQVIVLMHDGAGHEQTVRALPEIIRFFKQKGYAFAPLSSQVEPVHVSAVKTRWSRTVSMDQHQKLAKEAAQHRSAMAEEAQERQELQAPDSTGVTIMKETAAVPLEIVSGGRSLRLDPGQYWSTEGHVQVPLRSVIERMGGRVEWHDTMLTAVAHYGLRTVEYDFSRYELRVREGFRQTVFHLPQMELTSGTVYVPLRGVLGLLGNHIASYAADQSGIRVEVIPASRFAFAAYGF